MKIIYTKEQILERIADLGKEISNDYKDKDILIVGLLKGCTIFMSHLLVNINANVEIDFMTISSYKRGIRSHDFKFIQDLDTEVGGRDVLIIEDIIDTGKTLAFTQNHLKALGAKSIETAVLVYKTTSIECEFDEPKYIGFHYNENPFIVGFGFDYHGRYRNLPNIYQLEETDYSAI
jgi:hypoxanthine phosphoribosyltransferase